MLPRNLPDRLSGRRGRSRGRRWRRTIGQIARRPRVRRPARLETRRIGTGTEVGADATQQRRIFAGPSRSGSRRRSRRNLRRKRDRSGEQHGPPPFLPEPPSWRLSGGNRKFHAASGAIPRKRTASFQSFFLSGFPEGFFSDRFSDFDEASLFDFSVESDLPEPDSLSPPDFFSSRFARA